MRSNIIKKVIYFIKDVFLSPVSYKELYEEQEQLIKKLRKELYEEKHKIVSCLKELSKIKECPKLDPFIDNNFTIYINGKEKTLSSLLGDQFQLEYVYNYLEQNNLFIEDAKDPDEIIYRCFYCRRKYFPIVSQKDDDSWFTPKQMIENGFNGNAQDWMILCYYVSHAQFIHAQLLNPSINIIKYFDRLYCTIGSFLNDDGSSDGIHHPYLLWRSVRDNNFYVVETIGKNDGTILRRALNNFNSKEFRQIINYPDPIVMANCKNNYKTPKIKRI